MGRDRDAGITPPIAKRRLSYLATFESKIQGLKRGLDEIKQVSASLSDNQGGLPTEELEHIARSLVGAGLVYGLQEVTTWANGFLQQIDIIQKREDAATGEDFDWLSSKIFDLQQITDREIARAKEVTEEHVASSKRDIAQSKEPFPEAKVPPPRPAAREIAPAVKTLPPKPKEVIQQEIEENALPSSSSSKELYTPKPRFTSIPSPSVLSQLVQQTLVMVVAATGHVLKKVAFSLSNTGFDVKEISTVESAFEQILRDLPELVVVDADDEAPGGRALINALARDPLTNFIPVLEISYSFDRLKSNSIPKPINTEQLVAEARRIIGDQSQLGQIPGGLKDLSVKELTAFVTAEIQAGVLDSATGSQVDMRFSVKEEANVVDAVWSLVAHLRRVVATSSEGNIRFVPTNRKRIGIMALDEATDVLDPESQQLMSGGDYAALAGLRVVVADDDQEICTVFQKVLSQAGIEVRTASNGALALEMIRAQIPDLVITDILMPKMDGWELSTRLKRDYALKQIPIIMLSWKDDFLKRVRDLKVEADDFMLKELDQQQILGRIARMVRPRYVLRQRLSGDGGVTGRIERVGVLNILNDVAEIRPDCRIAFRENWNDYEVIIKDGDLRAVTRTGIDGSFASSMPALLRLISNDDGRFEVTQAVYTPKQQFPGGASDAIQEATEELNNMVDKVVDGALTRIEQVEIDKEVVAQYAEVTPPKLREPLTRLCQGLRPEEIINEAFISSSAMEILLLDMIRKGAITAISSQSEQLEQLDNYLDDSEIVDLSDETEELLDNSDGGMTVQELREVNSDQNESPPLQASKPPPLQASEPLPGVQAPPQTSEPIGGGVPSSGMPIRDVQSPQNVVSPPIKSRPSRLPQVLGGLFVLLIGFGLLFVWLKWPVFSHTDKSVAAPVEQVKVGLLKDDVSLPAPKKKDDKKELSATASKPSPQPEKTPEQKPEVIPASVPGVLSIAQPADDSLPIRVSVDNRVKGRAPIKLDLSPGEHHIAFSRDGKRSFRTVIIESKKTKKITAKVPN